MWEIESVKFMRLTTLPDNKEILLNISQVEAIADNGENTTVKMKSGEFYLIKEDFDTIVETIEDEEYI